MKMDNDLISRSALKRYIQENGMVYANKLDEFPTVDPESLRPKGRWSAWFGEPMWQECSACGYRVQYCYSKDCNYCPNCGAKMMED